MTLNPALAALLAPAYAPCVELRRACTEMRWNPEFGHVPRGFLGAAGRLKEVELVLVFAEPGDPHDGERHAACRGSPGMSINRLPDHLDHMLEACWR
jgi:hypothetical protein